MSTLCKINLIFLILLSACQKNLKIDFSPISPDSNLAFNDGNRLFPSPIESDRGWGGGIYVWHLVDGIRTPSNYWNMGLAFTGGNMEYIDTCGWRQATIDFGEPIKINRVIIWHHDLTELLPDSFCIQYWDSRESKWMIAKHVAGKKDMNNKIVNETNILDIHIRYSTSVFPYEESFSTVTTSKVRYLFNNCNIYHGWITEFEVYYDHPGDTKDNRLIRLEYQKTDAKQVVTKRGTHLSELGVPGYKMIYQ